MVGKSMGRGERAAQVSKLALAFLAGMMFDVSVGAAELPPDFIPERFNKPPRILFNINDSSSGLTEIVRGEFYQDFWHGVRLTVIRGHMITKPNATYETTPGYHGEEFIILLKGSLTFTFPESDKSYVLQPGDVFHFNNVLHHGVCTSAECEYVGVLSPPRLDYGDEGTPPSVEGNIAIEKKVGEKMQ